MSPEKFRRALIVFREKFRQNMTGLHSIKFIKKQAVACSDHQGFLMV